MSDQPVEPSAPSAVTEDDHGLIEVDVTAFLPSGVSLAGPDDSIGPEEPGPAPALPVDVEALTRIEAEFAAVDLALAALDDGTYGRCIVCAEVIDEALLGADPVRRGCASHPQASPTIPAGASAPALPAPA